MAKDPAFLFYANDFDASTKFFTDEQVGKYLRLLIAQFQHGRLSKERMIFVCKTYDNDVFSKFKSDEHNLYYNERLEIEIEKRKKYCESRRKSRIGKVKSLTVNKEDACNTKKRMKNIRKSYVKRMENENENENYIENITHSVENNIPSLEEFLDYSKSITGASFDFLKFAIEAKYQAWVDAGWKDGFGKPIKNWKTKIKNTLPHLKQFKQTQNPISNPDNQW